jgi:chromosome partitioning protein
MVWGVGERYPVRRSRRPRFRAILPLLAVDAGEDPEPGADRDETGSPSGVWGAPSASQRVEVAPSADPSGSEQASADATEAARPASVPSLPGPHIAVAGPHHGIHEPEHARAWLSSLDGGEGPRTQDGTTGTTGEPYRWPDVDDAPSGFGAVAQRRSATTEPPPSHPWRFVAGPRGVGGGDVSADVAPGPAEGSEGTPASSHADQLASESAALGVEPTLSGYDGAGGEAVPADHEPTAHPTQADPGGHEHHDSSLSTPRDDAPGVAHVAPEPGGGSSDDTPGAHGPHEDVRSPDASRPVGRPGEGLRDAEPEPAPASEPRSPSELTAPPQPTPSPDPEPAHAEPVEGPPEPPISSTEPAATPATTPGPVPGLANLRLPERQGPTELPTTRAIVVGVANQKGGVGKTTTTVSLAAAVAQAGVRTLVVDLDPQGNATTGLGRRAEEGDPSSYGVLVEGLPVGDAVQRTEVELLDVLPSSLDLAGAEVELVPAFSRELRLRRALESVAERYDLILVDCPPSLGLLTINALVASDQVLVPIQCEYYALEGLGQLMRTVQLVGDNLNRDLELGGVVLTMYDGRTKLSQQVVDEVRAYFGEQAYETVIPRTVRLSEAPSFGQPITIFDPTSRGSRAYERLAHEVIARLGLPSSQPPEPVDGRSALDRLLGGPAPAPPADPAPGEHDAPRSTAAPSGGDAPAPSDGARAEPIAPSPPTDATAPEQPEGQL